MKLTFHHIGIAVNSLDEAVENYQAVFGKESISKRYFVSSQQVNVCFVDIGGGSFLELVEATAEESSITRLRKKGYSYYHVAYKVADIEHSVKELELLHYKAFDFFHSEAFEGKRCIFLFSPDAHLIELIEQ